MTPSTPRTEAREHCEHECVCGDYINLLRSDKAEQSCNFEQCFFPCPHDTRTRPSQPKPDALDLIIAEHEKVTKEMDALISKQEADEMTSEEWEEWDILVGWQEGLEFAAEATIRQQQELTP